MRRPLATLLALLLAAGPALATWSIVVVNLETGEVCVASATCIEGMNLRGLTPVLIPEIGGAAAQAAGTGAVLDLAFTDKVRHHNATWLTWAREQLIKLGLNVPDGVGNFLLVGFEKSPSRGAEAADFFLKSEAIIVRRMDSYGLPECLRITIGTEEEMHTVVACLARFLERHA